MLAGMLMPLGLEVTLISVLLAGVAKEVYDGITGRGTQEALDAFATFLGGSVVVISTIVLEGTW